ncbi:hypothetical protein D3C75_636950 [compost metagenome]
MGGEGHQVFVERVILLAGFRQGLFQSGAGVFQVVEGGFARQEFVDRLAQGAVPVLVETVPELLGNRADTEQVDVSEIHVGLGIVILIPQISPADDGHAAVRQPQLVMHASMLLRQVEQSASGTCHPRTAAQVQRIEHSDLDLRVRGEGGNDAVQAIAGRVIKQYPHPHAPVGGLEQFLDQHARADAVVHDVVLQIEAALGVADQFGAGGEGLGTVR